MTFSTLIDSDNQSLRERLYAGEIFQLPATSLSLEVSEYIKDILIKHLGDPIETAHERMFEKEFLERMRQARLTIIQDSTCQSHIRRLMEGFNFSAGENAFDFLRARSVMPNGHLNPDLERSYSIHRDTWYSNPQCQVNWWIGLQDIPESRSFSFYPNFFDEKVENTSGNFSYNQWINKVGWQSTKSQQAFDYPRLKATPPEKERKTFSCWKGDILLFSAAHLHQTNKNTTDLTRFSMDFRTVHLGDHKNAIGAPNADNRSNPDALQDYIFPPNYKRGYKP